MHTEKLKTVDLMEVKRMEVARGWNGGLETGWLLGDRIQLDRRAGVQYSTVPQGNHGGGQLTVCFEEATREDLGHPHAAIMSYLR